MRHVVIGNGNLGNSLADKLLKKGHSVRILSASNGWKYPADLLPIYDFVPEHVWVTVGAGSVEQAKINYLPFIDLHVRLIVDLVHNLNKNISLHTFSSDYVIDKPEKSLYALSKNYMENILIATNKPKTYVYRVGSLYGVHKPQKCFPYKLKKNLVDAQKKGLEIKLPSNHITPTPTDWVADSVIHALNSLGEDFKIFNVAPMLCCKVQEWGELILQQPIKENDFDYSRPIYSNIGCDLPTQIEQKSWLDLWKEREQSWQDILNKIETPC